jgi:hypothetical protein
MSSEAGCASLSPGPDLPPAPGGDLCRALSWTSRAIWNIITDQLDQVLAGAQQRMIEERAVTDLAMTIVRRMSPGQADVVLFTQGNEATTGADFELVVFDGAGNYLAYLVQAKALKADGPKEGYPALGESDRSNVAALQAARYLRTEWTVCGPRRPSRLLQRRAAKERDGLAR